MLSVLVPGLGEVEVDESDLAAFQNLLNNHLAKNRKKPEPKKPVKPDTSIADQIAKDNKALMEMVVKEMAKIKPEVTVEAPEVKVEAPIVNVEAPTINTPEFPDIVMEANEPITSVSVTNISRDSKGMIETCDFEVNRG